MTDQTIELVFATLEAGGVRMPSSYHEDAGWTFAVQLWAGVLGDLEAQDLLSAAAVFLRSRDARFWPTPGQLLELVPGRRQLDDADGTWGEILEGLRRYGRATPPTPAPTLRGTPPQFEVVNFRAAPGAPLERRQGAEIVRWAFDEEDDERDAAIHMGLKALGGWRQLCKMQDHQVVANRAAFRGAYRAELERLRFRTASSTAKALLADGPARRLLG